MKARTANAAGSGIYGHTMLRFPNAEVTFHLYHHFDPDTCQSLTRRLAAALSPAGRLAVHHRRGR